MTTYRVSELAEQAGLPPSTVRFYERAGLVPARRSESGYRLFEDRAVDRIELITTGKRLGLPLEKIRELLEVWQDGLCRDVRDRLLPMVRSQIADAQRRAAEIDAFIERLRTASLAIDGPVPPGRCGSGCCDLPGPEAVTAADGLRTRRQDALPGPPAVCTLAAADRPGRRARSGSACSARPTAAALSMAAWRPARTRASGAGGGTSRGGAGMLGVLPVHAAPREGRAALGDTGTGRRLADARRGVRSWRGTLTR